MIGDVYQQITRADPSSIYQGPGLNAGHADANPHPKADPHRPLVGGGIFPGDKANRGHYLTIALHHHLDLLAGKSLDLPAQTGVIVLNLHAC